MTGLLWGVPGEEDRDGPPKSTYVTGRDIKWVAIALVILAFAFVPVYQYLKGRRDSSLCISQLRKISSAVLLYATNNDERFPPAVQVGPGSPGAPLVQDGTVYSWVSLVHRLSPDVSFVCPASSEDETVANQITDRTKGKQVLKSSYGMYAAYSGAPISGIERASQTFLIAETSNFGSQSSYDPVKFRGPDNQEIPIDGFAIGWNDSNVEPGPTTRSVTRLAFRNSAGGNFSEAYGRHGSIIHALTVDGTATTMAPTGAHVQMIAGQAKGSWATPPILP